MGLEVGKEHNRDDRPEETLRCQTRLLVLRRAPPCYYMVRFSNPSSAG